MFKCKKSTYSIFLYNGTKKTTPRRRIASKNHSAGEGTKALARPPIAGGVGRSDRVGNCTTRIRQEFSESDDYNNYLQVLQRYTRRIFRTAQLPAERQINTSGVSAAGIRRDEPDKRQTNNRQTDNRKTDKQQARTGGNNRQRTTYKKKVPLLRNLFTYCNTAPYSVSSATARNSATSSSVEFMT